MRRPPSDAFAVGTFALARNGVADREPSPTNRLDVGIQIVRIEREQCQSIVAIQCLNDLIRVRMSARQGSIPDAHQFEIESVGERNERIVRSVSRVLAAANHLEAQTLIRPHGCLQVVDGDQGVVNADNHRGISASII